jgi:hypothetical protein
MHLEMFDKKKMSRMRISRIVDTIGGRLKIKYENTDITDSENFVWCDELSDFIRPIGWSSTVGHDIHASEGKSILYFLKMEILN